MTWMTTDATHESPLATRSAAPPDGFPLHELTLPRLRYPDLLAAIWSGGFGGGLIAAAVHAGGVALWLVGLVVGAVVGIGWSLRKKRLARVAASRSARVVVEGSALVLLEQGVRTPLLAIDQPFGVTLLSTPAREVLVLALTHRDGVVFLAGSVPSGAHRTEILGRAVTTPANDLPLERSVPTFERGDRLLDLVAYLVERSPTALDRVYLSDASMADLVLDGRKLRAGQLDFDLHAPLRWRAYGFQEGTAFAAHGFQATQIRQGDREIVLVALAPTGELATSELVVRTPGRGPMAQDTIRRALARDLHLARGLADIPPPRAHRVAIDRLFMPRLRIALDLAPTADEPTTRIATPTPDSLQTPPEGIEHLRSSRP